MMITKVIIGLFFLISLVHAQFDYDDEESRRNHRRRPQHGSYNAGYGNPYSNPCGRDAMGRFINLQYFNINCHSEHTGGAIHGPANDFFGGGIGGGGLGGHRPQKPHRPLRPNKPLFGGGNHNQGGLLGGGGNHNQGGLAGFGGLFGNRPQSIFQDFTSSLGGFINRPSFSLPFGNNNNNNNNNNGLLGLGLIDGGIINSFANLFSNPINTNRPSSQVQYLEQGGNEVDEKPVHEDHDEITEPVVLSNRFTVNDRFIGGNYNRISNRVARSVSNLK